MVETDSHHKLLPASILDIHKAFEKIDMYVHGHTVAALHSYPHTTWLKFEGSWSLVESKCCQYLLVETDSHLKLLPASIFDIYKVFGQIHMLSMGIQ
jgi:hypothetical protein